MSDLKKRTITAIVLIAVLVPIVFFGGWFMYALGSLLTIGAAYELEKMFKKENKFSAYSYIDMALSAISYVMLTYSFMTSKFVYALAVISLTLLIEGFLMVFTKTTDSISLGNSLITIIYPSIGFASLAYLRNVPTELFRNGFFVLIYACLICVFTDMFAYFFGCKFGKHKLCERISPKKSWEGAIAGTVFAVVLSSAFAILTGASMAIFPMLSSIWSGIAVTLLSLILSIIDEIGDLFASKLKRTYGIKDYSQIFPGHGGILDRFDSYIFVGCALALLMVIL